MEKLKKTNFERKRQTNNNSEKELFQTHIWKTKQKKEKSEKDKPEKGQLCKKTNLNKCQF